MGNLDCNTPMQRNKDGRFAPGNTLCRAGFQAMLNKHFDGDKAAFNVWFGQLGYRVHSPAVFMHQWRQSSAYDVNFYESEPF